MAGRKRIDPTKFILAIAGGSTLAEATETAQISSRTASRWLIEHRSKIEAAKSALVAQTLDKLRGSLTKAQIALEQLLDNEDPRVQLAASKTIFDQFLRVSSRIELEERIRTIEEKLGMQ